MGVNGDGRLSYTEFVAACNRVRLLPECKRGASWSNDLILLFEQLDTDGDDLVHLDDLLHKSREPPTAAWWSITVCNIWGSAMSAQMLGPLKLLTKMQVNVGGISNMRSA